MFKVKDLASAFLFFVVQKKLKMKKISNDITYSFHKKSGLR